ncbi:MAG: hypothetical protein GEU71_10310 [Actinobacteria bacterium]|nr:hypothetical protein [Actinomycetota bacterium]
MLTQSEADALLALNKEFVDWTPLLLPPGADPTRELASEDHRETFLFDVHRASLKLTKVKYQTRGKRIFVLARIDIDGAPHTNPDGERISGTHIHNYREGYEDKWAAELDPSLFSLPTDLGQAYIDFCRFCKSQTRPLFRLVGGERCRLPGFDRRIPRVAQERALREKLG